MFAQVPPPLVDCCHWMVGVGVPLAEAAKVAGTADKPNWLLFDAYNARNATAAYSELEWE